MYILARSNTAMTCRATCFNTGACIVEPSSSAALACLLLLHAAPSAAQPAVRQVLMLQSFDRGNVSVDQFTGNFRVELDQRAGGP